MKIVARTPTELIIRDSAMPLRAIGAFLFPFGSLAIWLAFTTDAESGVKLAPLIIGAILVMGGVALLVLPAVKTFAFSKTDKVFIIAKQRFGRVEREMIPLRDVADVTLEESRDEGVAYRIAVTLKDQRRIPWTSYYTSGVASKRAIVDLVRDFLGLEANPALGSSAPTATTERDLRRTRMLILGMGAFCSLFLGIGAVTLAKEHRRLTTYRPVSATVLSTSVEEHSDSDGSTYEPVVVYRYYVDDRPYTASRVTPLKSSRSGRWAHRIVAKYRVGDSYTAYYDPAEPSEAFLMRSRSIIPWAFIAIPSIGLLILGVAYRGSREMTRAATVVRS
jgi:uncharacterized protein DUF3592